MRVHAALFDIGRNHHREFERNPRAPEPDSRLAGLC